MPHGAIRKCSVVGDDEFELNCILNNAIVFWQRQRQSIALLPGKWLWQWQWQATGLAAMLLPGGLQGTAMDCNGLQCGGRALYARTHASLGKALHAGLASLPLECEDYGGLRWTSLRPSCRRYPTKRDHEPTFC